MKTVRVSVPATTANLGPGFDCLGIALGLRNVTTVCAERSSDPGEMASAAASVFFERSGVAIFDFAWSVEGDVPRSRGLGSSVTVRLGILHGLNELAGRPLDRRQLFELCAGLEGHPDNAAPAAWGGFTIVPPHGAIQRYAVAPDLQFALLIPDCEISTPLARLALPASVPHRDAAKAAANCAAVAAAFATGQYALLRGCFDDTLHQPYRQHLLPCLPRVIEAGVAAGALGGWLSGSGSTIACLALGDPAPVAAAMLEASGLAAARSLCLSADNSGVEILG